MEHARAMRRGWAPRARECWTVPVHPGRSALDGLSLLRREASAGKMDVSIVETLDHILTTQGMLSVSHHGEHDLREAA